MQVHIMNPTIVLHVLPAFNVTSVIVFFFCQEGVTKHTLTFSSSDPKQNKSDG